MQQQLMFRYWSCKVWVTFSIFGQRKTEEFPSLLKVLSKWLSKSGSGRFTGLEKSGTLGRIPGKKEKTG